jgi:hypothetical protein
MKVSDELSLLLQHEKYDQIVPLLQKGVLEKNVFCIHQMIYAYQFGYWLPNSDIIDDNLDIIINLGRDMRDELCDCIARSWNDEPMDVVYKNPLAKFNLYEEADCRVFDVKDKSLYKELKQYGLENNDAVSLYYCYKYGENDPELLKRGLELNSPIFLQEMVNQYISRGEEKEHMEIILLSLRKLYLQNSQWANITLLKYFKPIFSKDTIDYYVYNYLKNNLNDMKKYVIYHHILVTLGYWSDVGNVYRDLYSDYIAMISVSCICKYIRGTHLDKIPKEIQSMIIKEIF